jgi:uncharacterized membrane protein HdeD (DUF308 family)
MAGMASDMFTDGDGLSGTGADRQTAMNECLARNWRWMMLRGVLAIVIGGIALAMPVAALAALTLVFGAYLLADGIVGIIAGVRAARNGARWVWLVIEGVLSMIAGGIAVALPGLALLSFVLLVAVWAVVSGLALLIAAFRLDQPSGRGWMILGGLLSVLWGVLLFLSPITGGIVLALWVGAYGIAFGLLMLVLAVRLRRRCADAAAAAAPGTEAAARTR